MTGVREVTKLKKLKGVKVLLRASLNVPIKDGKVENDFRLQKVIQTLRWLKRRRAKTIVISHFGDDGSKSLRPVAEYLNKFIRVSFVPWTLENGNTDFLGSMKNGDIVLLENLRSNNGEIANEAKLAKALASLADIYVNDDFAVSHRKHASVVAITKFIPSYIGPRFALEIKELGKVLKPKKPFDVILGGAKFETKLPLVKKFLPLANRIFIVGALANSFFKELGYNVGNSLVDKKDLGLKKLATNKKIFLPIDVVVMSGGHDVIKLPTEVTDNENILDNGPKTTEEIAKSVKDAKEILWNGPLGKFEEGYLSGTLEVAKVVSKSKGRSVIGGGDSIFAIQKLGLTKSFDFISTGGGAMLEYLAKGKLAGLEALKRRP